MVVTPAFVLFKPSSPSEVIFAAKAASRRSCSDASALIISRIRAVGSSISIMVARPQYPVPAHRSHPSPA